MIFKTTRLNEISKGMCRERRGGDWALGSASVWRWDQQGSPREPAERWEAGTVGYRSSGLDALRLKCMVYVQV